jgi:hypothetical protein
VSEELARYRRVASGPWRLRTGLAAHIRSLAELPARARDVRTAGARLPAALTGGAILDLVGSRLREALDAAGRSQPGIGARPRTAATPGWRAEPGHFSVSGPPLAAPVDPVPPGGPVPPGPPPRQRQPAAAPGRWPTSAPRPSQPPAAAAAPGPPPDPPAATSEPPRPAADAGLENARAARQPAEHPRPALDSLLRSYSTSPGLPGRSRQAEPDHTAASEPDGPPHQAPANDGPSVRAWPEAAADRVVRQLRAVAAPGTVPFSAQQRVVTAVPEKLEIQNVFNVEVHATAGVADLDDLAEQLAAVLREQALQHGVDVA